MPLQLHVDGRQVEVADDGASLLEVLRDRLGLRSPKDGCSPQGQCGCCTVLVDGHPRVACVTPARRVSGRVVTTLDGFPEVTRIRWASAFAAAGASQCGFCTPGIIVRLAALADRAGGRPLAPAEVEAALVAHLCRCTGWRSIVEAAVLASGPSDLPTAGLQVEPKVSRRASIEGGTAQQVGNAVALGHGGFADDTAPDGALVAVPDGSGGWAVGETLTEARASAGKVQGRRTTLELTHPLAVPPGRWALTLRTAWVEPGYLEPDASWCVPGGTPASPLGNGGAFGAKADSPLPATARRLADLYGRPVRVLLAREDMVRLGPKRPPVAAGIAADGTGVMRVARTAGIADAVAAAAPGLRVEEVDLCGPATCVAIRAAGWAEAVVLLAGLRWRQDGTPPFVVAPNGALAAAEVTSQGDIQVRVACGPPLEPVVLRSYAIGAAHQALSWVTSEGLAVDDEGIVHDLTIRSFGIVRARDMPSVEVRSDDDTAAELAESTGSPLPSRPVNGSDAVFAAVAAAIWIDQGLAQDWPTNRGVTT
jgi:xanthine dehydrogenase small subunit